MLPQKYEFDVVIPVHERDKPIPKLSDKIIAKTVIKIIAPKPKAGEIKLKPEFRQLIIQFY